jgi:transposase
MAGKRISMKKTREIIRLSIHGLSDRVVAQGCKVAVGTVGSTVRAAKRAGLYQWPLPELTDTELRLRLFGSCGKADRARPLPDFEQIDKQLRGKHVTRQLLWRDYREAHPDGYAYSQFCELYRAWRKSRGCEAVMRFEHRAGETLFVDWAGATIQYLENGVRRQGAMFVAVLGASDLTYACVYRDMTQSNWLQAHIDAFAYFGGVPEKVVPDNPRTATSRACRYDPELNPAYRELAEHYDVAVIPARPYKPRDKAKVENGVRNVGQQIIARLQRMQFLSFGELRTKTLELCDALNVRPFSKRDGSRRSLFEELERAALKPLPAQPFVRGEWKKATVFKDYHIELKGFFYSVPVQYIGAKVEVRTCGQILEIYYEGLRVAVHPIVPADGKQASTIAEHMPAHHRAILDQSVEDYLEKASRCGANCRRVAEEILNSFPRPEMGFRSCQGLLRLVKLYGHQRTEQACMRSLESGMPRYSIIGNMLKNHMEHIGPMPDSPPIRHANVRGSDYYDKTGSIT